MKLHAVDCFCGAGGMTQGLRDAGIDVVLGIDIDGRAGATYEANHGRTTAFLKADIRTVRVEDVRRRLQGRPASDLVLAGCSPCQFWSKMHTLREKSEQGSRLLLDFARLVEALRPGYVVVENVPGLARHGHEVLETFSRDLQSWGYQGLASGTVSCAKYGVPQTRERFLLLASRRHASITLPPHATDDPTTVRDVLGSKNGFARLEAGQRCPEDSFHYASALSPSNLDRIRMTPHDGGDRQAWSSTDLQIPAYVGRDEAFRNVYGRMWWDRPAPTLTTRFNSLSNGRFGHPQEDRALSLREGAALQTFPRDYEFVGTIKETSRQIGNAVPPALARAVGSHLRELARSDQASRVAG